MSRLIEADAVYKILESCEIRKVTIGNPLTDWEYGYTCGIERAESEIECAPTVDAVPARHGKWISNSPVTMRCNQCTYVASDWIVHEFHYCPNCGAKMDAEEDEE